ncbi:hypothetical protein IHE61_13040 [Streptomyces sp. GKU 257-1]|nr:hypothetical protein [Streptomyces sp. GKU 257-1]
MVDSYEKQRDPLLKERDRLAEEIASSGREGALDGTLSAHSSVVSRIAELNGSISDLRAEDTTPGRVVTEAVPPDAPAGPGLPLLLGLGAAVGVGLGLLAAWVRLVFDPAVRTPGDVVRALHAPVLGTLPRRRGRRREKRAERRVRAPVRCWPAAGSPRSTARSPSGSPTTRPSRGAAASWSSPPRGGIGTALAASVNLAASFAEMGKEVLLLEADLRTPSLTERLRHADGLRPGWARAPGHGTIGWPAGYRVPIDAGESGVFDLVPGHRVSKVPRALTSSAVSRLIGHADDSDSVLLVLAPAVLSYADAIALIDRVDCVLLVCDPREVRRDDLARVRELVAGAGGCVLGALLHSEGTGGDSGRGGASGPASPPDRGLPPRPPTPRSSSARASVCGCWTVERFRRLTRGDPGAAPRRRSGAGAAAADAAGPHRAGLLRRRPGRGGGDEHRRAGGGGAPVGRARLRHVLPRLHRLHRAPRPHRRLCGAGPRPGAGRAGTRGAGLPFGGGLHRAGRGGPGRGRRARAVGGRRPHRHRAGRAGAGAAARADAGDHPLRLRHPAPAPGRAARRRAAAGGRPARARHPAVRGRCGAAAAGLGGPRRCPRSRWRCGCWGGTPGARARTRPAACAGTTWAAGSPSSSGWATRAASWPSSAWGAARRPAGGGRAARRRHALRADERAVQRRHRVRPAPLLNRTGSGRRARPAPRPPREACSPRSPPPGPPFCCCCRTATGARCWATPGPPRPGCCPRPAASTRRWPWAPAGC